MTKLLKFLYTFFLSWSVAVWNLCRHFSSYIVQDAENTSPTRSTFSYISSVCQFNGSTDRMKWNIKFFTWTVFWEFLGNKGLFTVFLNVSSVLFVSIFTRFFLSCYFWCCFCMSHYRITIFLLEKKVCLTLFFFMKYAYFINRKVTSDTNLRSQLILRGGAL